jgi:hypothetical protein
MTTQPEPTLADVLRELQVLRREQRTAAAETRGSVAELRANLSELRLGLTERFDSVALQLTAIVNAIADFRQEYEQHTHGND